MPTLLVLAGIFTLCALMCVLLFPALRPPGSMQQPKRRLRGVILLALIGVALIGAGWYLWWVTMPR
jgi:drug/metabolite transporter (DMT)-like permease